MKILCIDTSSKEIAIGLFDGGRTLSESYINADRNYNAVIMEIISKELKKNGLKPADLDIFASTLGPGSFTGIRVGMAVMKGFAQALRKNFTGVTVLEILAAPFTGPVWPVLDAGRGEVYTACFGGKAGKKKAGPVFMLLTKEAFIKKAGKSPQVTGLKREGACAELLMMNPGIKYTQQEHVSMKVFAELISRQKNPQKRGLYDTAPVYIRPSEAEASLKRRNKESRKGKK